MKNLSRIFLSGLVAVVPLALTAALLVWLGVQSERLLGGSVRLLLPDSLVFPGLGLILGIGVVFGVGLLMQLWLVQQLFQFGEALLGRIPLIKTIYGSIRDVMQMFSRHDGEDTGKPVIVRLPGREEALLGFVTRDGLSKELGGEDTVAVYLPMSYQIGGYTLLLAHDQVEPLDMSAQDAMRFVLTAGIGTRDADARAKSTPGTREADGRARSTNAGTEGNRPPKPDREPK
jgi:uncharacterized membrane protein